MKSLRSIFIGMTVLGIIACLSSVSFAEKEHKSWKEREAAQVKLYNEAAAVLHKSNPALAKEMKAWADEEANEAKVKKEHMEARIKLLKESAAALKVSNPDLSKKLLEQVEWKEKKLKKISMEEKNEKEEPGEKAEPKEEQGENK